MKKEQSLVFHFIEGVDEMLEQFCLDEGVQRTKLEYESKDKLYHCRVDMGCFRVVFFFGEYMSLGYSFLEGTVSNLARAGLIARFEFNFSPYLFSPYDIHNVLELSSFTTLDFHNIIDDEMLEGSANIIFDFIRQNRSALELMTNDTTLQQRLVEKYERDMKVLSKKLEGTFEKDFRKGIKNHELEMYFHNDAQIYLNDYILDGKTAQLKKHLMKRSAQGRLLTFEERYFDYLINHDFPVPQFSNAEATKKLSKTDKKLSLLQSVSIIAAVVLMLLFALAASLIVERVVLSDYIILSDNFFLDYISIPQIVGIAGLEFFLSLVMSKRLYAKKQIKSIFYGIKKKEKIIMSVICIGAVIWGISDCISHATRVVAINESGIYYNLDGEKEILGYDNDKLEFFIVDTYSDEGRLVESPEMYVVAASDYEATEYLSLDEEEIESTEAFLTSKGVTVFHYVTYNDYCKEHNIS